MLVSVLWTYNSLAKHIMQYTLLCHMIGDNLIHVYYSCFKRLSMFSFYMLWKSCGTLEIRIQTWWNPLSSEFELFNFSRYIPDLVIWNILNGKLQFCMLGYILIWLEIQMPATFSSSLYKCYKSKIWTFVSFVPNYLDIFFKNVLWCKT